MMVDKETGEIVDNSVIINELKVELKRIGEKLNGKRVHDWCVRAGYPGGIFQLDRNALLSLLNAVKRQ